MPKVWACVGTLVARKAMVMVFSVLSDVIAMFEPAMRSMSPPSFDTPSMLETMSGTIWEAWTLLEEKEEAGREAVMNVGVDGVGVLRRRVNLFRKILRNWFAS